MNMEFVELSVPWELDVHLMKLNQYQDDLRYQQETGNQ